MTEYPQKLFNFEVRKKIPLKQTSELQKEIEACEKDLENKGRAVVRYSGTENKIRILVEAKESSAVEKWTGKLGRAIAKELC
jgi:phosphoglucosamine mutase